MWCVKVECDCAKQGISPPSKTCFPRNYILNFNDNIYIEI